MATSEIGSTKANPVQGRAATARITSVEHTRHALLHAALKLFGEKGFDAASTREIAAVAKANIGSIAYHFGGKEGLREACAAYIVETIGGIAGDAFAGVNLSDPRRMSPAEAEAFLLPVLESMVGFIVSRPEAGAIVQFILREMAHPTQALDTIYEGVFEPFHKKLCGLWKAATGEPADSDRTKLTVFTLFGQVIYFRIGREVVKRRMGWRDIGQREADAVLDVTRDNLLAIVASRRDKRG
ncbi:TetR family transcriptional regulator [Mesorhizobium sp. J18]|uniref:CerR family C-terminal domain-containing protein n=1 Tax=Mesorhizobium sp. J18 TaxID=935263 RepID=UPI00119A4D10|nr:CerR family C-terminal domain-containing protein [Mesorhizobium sp. J18]TWG91367.1 TetR family transcriptional regulator [Mesorhizobium sp. J18]